MKRELGKGWGWSETKHLEDKCSEENTSPKGRGGQFLPGEFPAFTYQHQEDPLVPVVMADQGKEASPPSSSGPKGS